MQCALWSLRSHLNSDEIHKLAHSVLNWEKRVQKRIICTITICSWKWILCQLMADITHRWKCQLAKTKELSIPPIWGCWGPTRNSFFTHGQIKHPPFFEGRWYTGKIIRQIWAEWAVCLHSYLWKGWMFYLSMGQKWIPSGSTTIPDRWYQKFFFFGWLALPMMCEISPNFSYNLLSVYYLLLHDQAFNRVRTLNGKVRATFYC